MKVNAYTFGMVSTVAGISAVCSNGWWSYAYAVVAALTAGLAGGCWRRSFTEREE